MLLQWLARRLAAFLSRKVVSHSVNTSQFEALRSTLRPGDVLLVEGDLRISVAIRYLTQSTWSHAALYLGPDAGLPTNSEGEPHTLIEADLEDGIRSLELEEYRHLHTRICRPVGLDPTHLQSLIDYATSRLGQQYDLKNVIDLARYLCPTPPIPSQYRRRMLAFGSGDPTRAICSTFIAQAFQTIRYPILPERVYHATEDGAEASRRELYRIRHHSLFVPRDFDASPYFEIVKPCLAQGFDYRAMVWADHTPSGTDLPHD